MLRKKHKIKKRLSQSEEFEIMKLVLDKFLWLATAIIGYGFYLSATKGFTANAIGFLVTGIVLFGLFIWLIVGEYEIVK